MRRIEPQNTVLDGILSLEQNRICQRLTIIGTAHVDESSVQRVQRVIAETRPSVVAVELCQERLEALRDPDREKLGLPFRSGFLLWLLALLEKAVGSLTGVFPGSEMLEAVDEAERVQAQVMMIDKPVSAIFDELRNIPTIERFRIGIDALVALFQIGMRPKMTRLKDATLDKMMVEFDSKYPTLSRILVKERDRYMADRLREILSSTSGQIVAVVGLGHVKGIRQHLAECTESELLGRSEFRYDWTVDSFAI